MAFTQDHRAIEYIAKTLLEGQKLLDSNIRENKPSSLLFGSAVRGHTSEVTLNITENTWFECQILSEPRCRDEHLLRGENPGLHISWLCPQFKSQANRYKEWTVESVSVNGQRLTLSFDEKVHLICDGQEEDADGGWALAGNFLLTIGQTWNTLEPYGSVPDEIHTLFNQGWDWKRDDQ